MDSLQKTTLTPLIKFKDNIFLKDESKNSFGTYKDRISKVVIQEALKRGVQKIILITSGNAGYSLANFARGTGVEIICLIDKGDSPSIKSKLKEVITKLIEIDLTEKIFTPEEIFKISGEEQNSTTWNGIDSFYSVYADIVKEIKEEKPDYIVVPVGSGEAFLGIYEGIKKYSSRTKLIGIGVKTRGRSFADKLWSVWIPLREQVDRVVKEGNEYFELTEDEIKQLYDENKDMFDCEPSSSVVFGVFLKKKFGKDDKVVLINSGKGIF